MVKNTYSIEEIPLERTNEFFSLQMKYLIDDKIITDKEDIEYFESEEYRGIIRAHMAREIDKHHMVYTFSGTGRESGQLNSILTKARMESVSFLTSGFFLPIGEMELATMLSIYSRNIQKKTEPSITE